MTTVLITGSRDWNCAMMASIVVTRLVKRYGSDLLVRHGACKTGVDAAFDRECKKQGVDLDPMPADWTLGRRAGPLRNAAMVAKGADFCLAFSIDITRSHGTRDCMEKAIEAGIPTYLNIDSWGSFHRIRDMAILR